MPKAQKQQIIADIYQSLAVLSPISPSIHKHCVNFITITCNKLVPLSIKLWHNGRKFLISFFFIKVSIDCQSVCGFFTSSINLAWPCWIMGLMAFCSKPTAPGYSILLPNEWAIRKLARKNKKVMTLQQHWTNTLYFPGKIRHKGTIKLNTSVLHISPYCDSNNKSELSCRMLFDCAT